MEFEEKDFLVHSSVSWFREEILQFYTILLCSLVFVKRTIATSSNRLYVTNKQGSNQKIQNATRGTFRTRSYIQDGAFYESS